MSTKTSSSSDEPPIAVIRWYQRWEVWVLSSLALGIMLPILLWFIVGAACLWMYDSTIAEVRAAGYQLTRDEYVEEYTRKWHVQRDAHPLVGLVSTRLSLFGSLIAQLQMAAPVQNIEYPPDKEPAWDSHHRKTDTGISTVREELSNESEIGDTMMNLSRTFYKGWLYEGKEMNTGVLLPGVYPWRVAVLWRRLLAMDFPEHDAAEEMDPGAAMDLHAIFFMVMNRSGQAAEAWREAMRCPVLVTEQCPAITSQHLKTLAVATRIGLLREADYLQLLETAKSAVTADGVRHLIRNELRYQISSFADDAIGCRKFGQGIYLLLRYNWTQPLKIRSQFQLHHLLPDQFTLLYVGAGIREMAAYEAQLAREDGQPGLSLPRVRKGVQSTHHALITAMGGARHALAHNTRLAILAFGLWRSRHPGKVPAGIEDFLDAETRAAFISVPGATLEYMQPNQGTSVAQCRLYYKVDRAIAPTLSGNDILLYHDGDDEWSVPAP
ncbi:MAG: hypothetical protein ACAI35_05450 [Candidatus Methylacidiphilales bacterium]|nr:hypothetical protein [Candidatus Methylacidiphilales bacterium]